MDAVMRRSPVSFAGAVAARSQSRGDWQVVLEYQDQGQGPWLVDLSHCPRWDLQDSSLDELHPWGLAMPQGFNQVLIQDGWLVNRLNRTQAQLWYLGGEEIEPPAEPGLTEITDGQCLLALVGDEALSVMETACKLDLADPSRTPPFLVQGPVLHIPCQIVRLAGAVLMGFSRGYGQSFAEALLESGRPWGLKPGGEEVFSRLLAG